MSFKSSKTQIGTEATKGTAVAATAIWRGPAGHISDERETYFPKEHIGNMPGKDRAITTQKFARLAMPEADATFEQLGYILGSALEAESGVQDGTGSGYIYTFDSPVDSVPALSSIKSRTIETGDDQQAEEMEYAIVNDFTLRGRGKEPLKVSANWFGRQAVQSTFTGSLSLPSVEEILFNKAELFIDDASGTIGSTQISGELLEMEFRYVSGWEPRFTPSGELYFTLARFKEQEAILNLIFEHETNSIAEKEDWRDETSRLIRLQIEGSAVTTPGTTYSNKTFILDLAGRWMSWEPVSERDGFSTIAASFLAKDNDTADLYMQMVLVNELTALP